MGANVQFSPAGAGAWSNIGGADIAPPYAASWNTALVADGPYDLRAVVTDTTGSVLATLPGPRPARPGRGR